MPTRAHDLNRVTSQGRRGCHCRGPPWTSSSSDLRDVCTGQSSLQLGPSKAHPRAAFAKPPGQRPRRPVAPPRPAGDQPSAGVPPAILSLTSWHPRRLRPCVLCGCPFLPCVINTGGWGLSHGAPNSSPCPSQANACCLSLWPLIVRPLSQAHHTYVSSRCAGGGTLYYRLRTVCISNGF